MKIRAGFVSNSSSSSFIVAFPKIPESWEDVKYILFRNTQHISIYDMISDTDTISKIVYNDIVQQGNKITFDRVHDAFNGWHDEYPDYDEFRNSDGLVDWDTYESVHTSIKKRLAEQFMMNNKDSVIYTFEYSDNDGDVYCIMEHYGIFDRLNHEVISRH